MSMGGVARSYNRYTTGNKVYGGGRSYATAGTVDPAGYVDRERRSGLAKAALHPTGGGYLPEAMVGETSFHLPAHVLARIVLARKGAQLR